MMAQQHNTPQKKSLKRVDGELQLAPILVDQHRPVSAGIRLKRCTNDFNIYHQQQQSTEKLKGVYYKESTRLPPKLPSFTAKDIQLNETITAYAYKELELNPKLPSNHELAAETSVSSIERNNSISKDDKEANKNESYHNQPSCYNFEDRNRNKRVSRDFSQVYSDRAATQCIRPQQVSTFYSCTTYTARAMMSSGITMKEKAMSGTFGVEKVNTVITTGMTLDLPESNQKFSCGTPSPIWSLQNHVGTANSAGEAVYPLDRVNTVSPSPSSSSLASSGKWLEQKEAEGLTSPAIETSSRSQIGAGDRVIDSRDNDTSTPTFILPRAPQTSAATSESDKPPFMLTFRKPKPIPRSRITSTAGSTRYSLPTTASTPNPIQLGDTETNNTQLELDDRNNNNTYEEDPNNNYVEDDNNNKIASKPTRKLSKTTDRSLLSLLNEPRTTPVIETDVIVQPVSETNKTSSLPKKTKMFGKNQQMAPKKAMTIEQQVSHANNSDDDEGGKSWRSTSSSKYLGHTGSASGSNSNSGSFSNSGSSKTLKSVVASKANPKDDKACIRTDEKGQIRFMLPGRIQHKTTIKVAHFPTDDRKVILNVKPEEEEDEPLTVPIQGISENNNNNFFMPPPQPQPPIPDFGSNYGPSPYAYPPYGYPPPPPYYGYGYPPYY